MDIIVEIIKKRLIKETSWKWADKYSLYHHISIWFIEDYRLVNRIAWVGDEVYAIIHLSVFFEGCLIIDEGDHDFSIFWDIGFPDEDEIPVFHSFLIHGVSLSPEEKVIIISGEELGRYGDLRLDVFLCKYRHPTGDRTDERYPSYLVTIGRILRWDLDIISSISVEPSLFHDLIKEYWYRARRGVSEGTLECSYRDLFSAREVLSHFLEEELFFGGEFFHRNNKYIQCIQ